MKAILAGDPGLYDESSYQQLIYNCTRGRCEIKYGAPLPDISKAEIYIFFGSVKPAAIQIQFISTCGTHIEDILAQDYVVGNLPNGQWYGVFKNFTAPVDYDPKCFVLSFVITFIDATELRYFSQEYCIGQCEDLMEVRSCYPDGNTLLGFDINNIYYGFHNGFEADILGSIAIRYYHRLYVRYGQVLNTSHKTEFKVNTYTNRNLRTQVTKLWEFSCEFVPEYYKDYIMAVMARGVISTRKLSDGILKSYLLNDTAFELLDPDAKLWKTLATLQSVNLQYFGCDASTCVPPCVGSPTNLNMSGPVGGDYTFTFAGGSLGAGETIEWNLVTSPGGVSIATGSINALPMQFVVNTDTGFDPVDNCYLVLWRKVCRDDDGGYFSLDFSDVFSTGSGTPNATAWVNKQFGNCDGGGGGGGGGFTAMLITTNDALGDVCVPSPTVIVNSDTPHIGPGTHLYNFVTGLPLSGFTGISEVKEVGFVEVYAFDNAGLVGAHVRDC